MTTVAPELIEEMFVQTARGATSADGVLTLSGLSPSTLYFSDRPERVVGHMKTGQFVEHCLTDPNEPGTAEPGLGVSCYRSGP